MDDKKEEGVENEAVEQLAFADRIILNKKDLVSAEELKSLETRIRTLNSFAPLKVSQNSVVDLDFILNIKAFDLQKVLENEPQFLQDQDHKVFFDLIFDAPFISFSMTLRFLPWVLK